MEPSRVYKIKIRENILRQVIFTDKNLFISIIILIIYLVWNCLGTAPVDIKVLSSLCISGIALLIVSIKIDRQSIIKIFLRSIIFINSNKKIRY